MAIAKAGIIKQGIDAVELNGGGGAELCGPRGDEGKALPCGAVEDMGIPFKDIAFKMMLAL